MLDVRRMVVLRELTARGTLAAVAEAMGFSPSAVSQQLAQLEREAGVPLLRRAGRRVQLTPQGEVLVAAAGEVLDVLERAEARLAASATTVRGRVRVEVVQREPEAALQETWARDFDVVVAEEYPAHAAAHLPGLVRHDLTTDALRLALPPSSPAQGSAALEEARTAAWVVEPRGTASRHFAEQVCRTAGFEPDVRYETADLQAQIRLVESGNAVTVLPDLVWTGRTPTCRLVDLPGSPRRTIFTAQRLAGQDFPAVRAFREALERAVPGGPHRTRTPSAPPVDVGSPASPG